MLHSGAGTTYVLPVFEIRYGKTEAMERLCFTESSVFPLGSTKQKKGNTQTTTTPARISAANSQVSPNGLTAEGERTRMT